MNTRAYCVALMMLLVPVAVQAQASPQVAYQGRLLKDGAPMSGTVALVFSIHAQAEGGAALWSEEQTLALTDGYYATYLGSGAASTGSLSAALDASPRYLQVAAAGVALTPRQLLGTVPFAMSCSVAKAVDNSVTRVKLTVADQLKDLGDILKSLLVNSRALEVTLPANTDQWKWNVPIVLENNQDLTIIGEGHRNGACNITVVVHMTENGRFTREDQPGVVKREPVRARIGRGSKLALVGVKIIEDSKDSRELTDEGGGALFALHGMNSVIEIMQTKVTTTESLVGVTAGAFANIRFGHTRVEGAAGMPAGRVVYATRVHQGWGFGPGVAYVHNTHYKLVNSEFGVDPRRLFYTEDPSRSELWPAGCVSDP